MFKIKAQIEYALKDEGLVNLFKTSIDNKEKAIEFLDNHLNDSIDSRYNDIADIKVIDVEV